MGTWGEWASVVVNGAVAWAALVGLRRARRDTLKAEDRASAAEAALEQDRARRATAALARADLAATQEILQIHGTHTRDVLPSPEDVGRMLAALAALPDDAVPCTRRSYPDGRWSHRVDRPSRTAVSEELRAEVQRLRRLSVLGV